MSPSWLCQVERVSAKLKVTMPNDSKEWRSVVSKGDQERPRQHPAPTPWSQKFTLVARTHLQQTKQYKQVGECFGVSRVSDLHDFIFQCSFCLKPSYRQVIESQFPASKVLMGDQQKSPFGTGSVVWTSLERKQLSNF